MARAWNERANELAAESYRAGAPLAWFDRLYAEGAAGEIEMPWDRSAAHPLLAEWADAVEVIGAGRRAVVVGCGVGADAEFLAGRGYTTTGFDISPTAVEQARVRHPQTSVDYRVADLLALPHQWHGAFDLVVEIFTLQAVPDPPRAAMAAAVRSLVAPLGTLVFVAFRNDGSEPPDQGPPFPLTEEFVLAMATDGLEIATLERLEGPLWRVTYRR